MDLGAFTDGQTITLTGQTNISAMDDRLEVASCMMPGMMYGM